MKATNVREELIASAEDLIRRRGYSGYSYADVSERVGIRKPTIHYYFPTKQDLTYTALQAYRARYKSALLGIEDEFDHALDRIDAYGRLYLSGVEKELGCLCAALSAELDNLPEELKGGTVDFFREHLDWIERIYARGRQKGEINNNLTNVGAARLVISSLEGALMMERLLDGPAGFEIMLKALRLGLSPAS
ncbi:TetR/AcrR family transcriptional repressor of nem operon [Neorhizobium galegae]|uniref:TetR/AcrR family transcriptional regulator n=1 Tax=Neorhizobium galegae TaxID=399 RepID=UPI001AE13E3E|nr:TetR/AcrR family transcriptional regulator [Neorhizobium galegae]MBP2562560.1 TetR/AcrR family transcriptional repressor of nem operon [Neorhizobium galegae]